MEEQKALSIIATLAQGVDPLTGEAFPPGSPYQSPDIVRALFTAARILEGAPRAESANAARPARTRVDPPSNVGKPWSPEEDQRLLSEFERGRTPRELASVHGRTLAGVEARLEKHGRLQPQQRVTSNRYPQDRNDQKVESTSRTSR
jgi:hypothetical protein